MNPEPLGPQENNSNPPASSQPNPAPVQPPAAPWAQAPSAQVSAAPVAPVLQPQPVTAGQQPPVKAKSGFKKPLVVVLTLVLLAAAGFGAFTFASSLSNGQEAEIGSEFITAIQDKDYATIEKLADTRLVSLGDKINQAGGAKAKDGFYKSYVNALDKEVGVGPGNPQKVKVTKETGYGISYAFVTYRAGAKDITVLEVYNDETPKVIAAKSGIKAYKPGEFKREYIKYIEDMGQMSKLIDQIAASSSDNSKQTIEALFTTE